MINIRNVKQSFNQWSMYSISFQIKNVIFLFQKNK